MKNITEFMIQAIFSLIIVVLGVGVIFSFATGSTEHFIPFIKLGSIVVMTSCLGLLFLHRA